jgi:hypothetical protein
MSRRRARLRMARPGAVRPRGINGGNKTIKIFGVFGARIPSYPIVI